MPDSIGPWEFKGPKGCLPGRSTQRKYPALMRSAMKGSWWLRILDFLAGYFLVMDIGYHWTMFPWKLIGRQQAFPFGKTHLQVRTVSFREGIYYKSQYSSYQHTLPDITKSFNVRQILLMEEILHQLKYPMSRVFLHTRWLFGISSINSCIRKCNCSRSSPNPNFFGHDRGCLVS